MRRVVICILIIIIKINCIGQSDTVLFHVEKLYYLNCQDKVFDRAVKKLVNHDISDYEVFPSYSRTVIAVDTEYHLSVIQLEPDTLFVLLSSVFKRRDKFETFDHYQNYKERGKRFKTVDYYQNYFEQNVLKKIEDKCPLIGVQLTPGGKIMDSY